MIFQQIPDYLVVLILYLLFYFVVHSVLASLSCKRWFAQRWPKDIYRYRLLFNALAIVMLIPLIWMRLSYDLEPLWQWQGVFGWGAYVLAFAALVGFIHSLTEYDLGLFSGFKQWQQQRESEESESFRIGFWHRFVRHPWYFFLLVLLWTQEPDLFQLVLYVMISGYLIVGSRLEEAKLVHCYGDRYQRYRRLVPGLIPVPWKWLTKQQAQELASEPDLL